MARAALRATLVVVAGVVCLSSTGAAFMLPTSTLPGLPRGCARPQSTKFPGVKTALQDPNPSQNYTSAGAAQLTRADILRSVAALAIGVVATPANAFPPPGFLAANNAPPSIKEASTAEQIALAEHLKAKGAVFYGAYWCPYCTLQRQMFGAGGAAALPYVECADDGFQSETGLCRTKSVTSYPTWQIDGKYYAGLKPLSALQALSCFDPSVKFAQFVPPGAPPRPKPPPGGYTPPAVDTASTPFATALAQHLKATGAQFYGAYWCKYCNKQRQLFGAAATAQLPYVECAEDGAAFGGSRCEAVTGYPTWEIGGKFFGGYQSLEALAQLSGFTPDAKPAVPVAAAGGAGSLEQELGVKGLGGPVGKKDEDCTLTNGKEECIKKRPNGAAIKKMRSGGVKQVVADAVDNHPSLKAVGQGILDALQ